MASQALGCCDALEAVPKKAPTIFCESSRFERNRIAATRSGSWVFHQKTFVETLIRSTGKLDSACTTRLLSRWHAKTKTKMKMKMMTMKKRQQRRMGGAKIS